MRLPVFALLCALAAAGACERPSFRYALRPPSPPPTTAAERCYHDQRLEVSTGTVTWTRHRPYTSDTYISSYYLDSGLVLYQGGRRLETREAVRRIGDANLAHHHGAVLASTAGAYRSYPALRGSALALAFGGAALVVGGALWVLADDDALVTDDNRLGGAGYAMLGGLGASTLSLIPGVLAYTRADAAIQHERDSRLFSDARTTPHVVEGAWRHNQRVAARCGFPGPDLPMTRDARQALER